MICAQCQRGLRPAVPGSSQGCVCAQCRRGLRPAVPGSVSFPCAVAPNACATGSEPLHAEPGGHRGVARGSRAVLWDAARGAGCTLRPPRGSLPRCRCYSAMHSGVHVLLLTPVLPASLHPDLSFTHLFICKAELQAERERHFYPLVTAKMATAARSARPQPGAPSGLPRGAGARASGIFAALPAGSQWSSRDSRRSSGVGGGLAH